MMMAFFRSSRYFAPEGIFLCVADGALSREAARRRRGLLSRSAMLSRTIAILCAAAPRLRCCFPGRFVARDDTLISFVVAVCSAQVLHRVDCRFIDADV